MKVGIACGGTGGHIFPGLAVAKVLKDRQDDVVLFLAGRDVEASSTAEWKGAVVSIGGRGLPSGLSLRSLRAAVSLLGAFLRCWGVMRNNRPAVLLAMGGYGSVGPVLAARVLRIPVVLHEANAIPGRAIDVLARYATAVAVSFESSARYFNHPSVLHTGFPVRPDIYHGKEKLLASDRFTVLVMGGSQGAHRLNELAAAALCQVHQMGIPVQVIHLAGKNDESTVRHLYEAAGIACCVRSFLKDMAGAYDQADLAIARSGAASCAELIARAVPAVLVPLPSAMRDHQTANAQSVEKIGGAVIMHERELSAEKLSEFIRECYRNPEKLDGMGEALRKIPANDAAVRIAGLLETLGAHDNHAPVRR